MPFGRQESFDRHTCFVIENIREDSLFCQSLYLRRPWAEMETYPSDRRSVNPRQCKRSPIRSLSCVSGYASAKRVFGRRKTRIERPTRSPKYQSSVKLFVKLRCGLRSDDREEISKQPVKALSCSQRGHRCLTIFPLQLADWNNRDLGGSDKRRDRKAGSAPGKDVTGTTFSP